MEHSNVLCNYSIMIDESEGEWLLNIFSDLLFVHRSSVWKTDKIKNEFDNISYPPSVPLKVNLQTQFLHL